MKSLPAHEHDMSLPGITSRPVRTSTRKKIPAIQVAAESEQRLGLFTELPIDTEMEVVDSGFSETTLKVRCHGQLYFIFRQDIEL